jgi:hypothetical protein
LGKRTGQQRYAQNARQLIQYRQRRLSLQQSHARAGALGGDVYRYLDVPPLEYHSLMRTNFKGRFVNVRIKGR